MQHEHREGRHLRVDNLLDLDLPIYLYRKQTSVAYLSEYFNGSTFEQAGPVSIPLVLLLLLFLTRRGNATHAKSVRTTESCQR